MTIPIRGTAKGTPESAYAEAVKRGATRLDFLHPYLIALYADATTLGLNADLLVAQWDLETGAGTSDYWQRDGNPAGLAAFDDGTNWGLTFTPETAARAQVTHMARYAGVPNVPPSWIATDARWEAAAKYAGTVTTVDDLGNGKWATDPDYARKLLERYVIYWGTPEEDTPMAKYPVALGGGKTALIESIVPIRQAIISASQTNQRPGYKIDADFWCQHENGNPKHDADDERRYFHMGAEGRQASYHFVGDDTEIIQLLPLNENGWHAGDTWGPGNMKSIAGSIAQGARDMAKARTVMEHLAAGVMKALGIPAANTRQHYDFAPNRKNCPQWIRRDGYWSTFQKNVVRLMSGTDGGSQPTPVPQYATPIQLAQLDITAAVAPAMVILDDEAKTECIWVGDRVRAVRNTPRLQWAGAKAPRVGPDIAAGTEFDVDWLLKNKEGWFYYTPWDSRIRFADCERISDSKAA